jgi:hypothetical protein
MLRESVEHGKSRLIDSQIGGVNSNVGAGISVAPRVHQFSYTLAQRFAALRKHRTRFGRMADAPRDYIRTRAETNDYAGATEISAIFGIDDCSASGGDYCRQGISAPRASARVIRYRGDNFAFEGAEMRFPVDTEDVGDWFARALDDCSVAID